MNEVCFIETETISLARDHRHLWEVAVIYPDPLELTGWGEYSALLADVPLGEADPMSLQVSRFHERYSDQPVGKRQNRGKVARQIEHLTRGQHLVGAVPSFDEQRLWDFLRAHNLCPTWHYHLIDVETLGIGYMAGVAEEYWPEALKFLRRGLPWDSSALAHVLGMDQPEEDKHTALGDARWAKAIYEKVMGNLS